MSKQSQVAKCAKPSRKAFSFPEIAAGLVIIFIVVTLASPSYYRMINHFRSSAAAASARTIVPALIVYWDEEGSFQDINEKTAVPRRGGPIEANGKSIGAHLPEIDKISWYIVDVTPNSLSIEWKIDNTDNSRAGLELEIKSDGAGYQYPQWEYYDYE